MNLRISYISIVFCLWSCFPVHAQLVNNLNIDNGLAHADAECVLQDEQGFIWIGTGAGLQRYDGYELKKYDSESELIPSSSARVQSMLLQNDYLWLMTQAGLLCFHTLDERFVPLIGEGWRQINKGIIKLGIKSSDELWALIEGSLYVMELNTISDSISITCSKVGLPIEYASEHFQTFAGNQHNILWLTTDSALYQFSADGHNTLLDWKVDLPQISKLKWYESTQELWAMSYSAIRCLKMDPFQRTYAIKNIRRKYLMNYLDVQETFLVDFTIIDDALFLAVNREGFYRITDVFSDNMGFTHYTVNDSYGYPSSNSVHSIFYSRERCIFICQNDGGVDILDNYKKKFRAIKQGVTDGGQSISLQSVSAIAGDDNGNLWLGTRNNGLFLYQSDKNQIIKLEDYISSVAVRYYNIKELIYHSDTLYIASNAGLGILSIKNRSFTHIPRKMLWGNHKGRNIISMSKGNSGVLWLGYNQGGIDRVDISQPNHPVVDRLTGVQLDTTWYEYDKITQIEFDSAQHTLLLSDQFSITRCLLDSASNIRQAIIYFPNTQHRHQNVSSYLWDFVQMKSGELWVANIGVGLCQMQLTDSLHADGSGVCGLVCYGVDSGAPSLNIESLLLDKEGNIWMGSKGLSLFNPITRNFWNFDITDGISGNGFLVKSAFCDTDGKMYFGGTNGVTYFSPDSIFPNRILPRIALSNIYINQKLVRKGEQIDGVIVYDGSLLKVKHSQNNIAIEFSALHFVNPGKHKYRYKLEGYDDEWVTTSGSNRRAIYSNLDYGTYQFIVDGTNNDGFWSESPYELQILVIAPWWQTPLAYVLYLILLLILLGSFYLYRIRMVKLQLNLRIAELQTENQEELLKAKLQFFTNISHEFKVYLSLIYAPLERLINARQLSTNVQSELFESIKRNVNRLLELVNELMDFRKIETGNSYLNLRKTDTRSFFSDISELFIDPMAQKSIAYNYFLDSDLPVSFIDTEKVTKITINLISNAQKYTSTNGSVRVEVSNQWHPGELMYSYAYHISNSNNAQNKIYIKVIDNGIGISPGSISQIFERFFQVEESEKEQHLGSGIGLAYTKSLVIMHKGEIWVSSEKNKGTEFVVALPVDELFYRQFDDVEWNVKPNDEPAHILNEVTGLIDSDALAEVNPKTVPANSGKILIVEDNSEMRKHLVDWLSQSYHVHEASNGQEALCKLNEQAIDLIITDVMMPFMDGYEFTAIVKSDIRFSHIPVVMLTARNAIDDQLEGVKAGADIFIPKPFSIRFVERSIANLFRLHTEQKERYKRDIKVDSDVLVINAQDKQFMESAIQLIEEDLQNPDFKLDQLYKGIGMSKTPFYNKIKAISGLSPQEFVRNVRMKKAAQLLQSGQEDINQIALDVGFKNHSHFSKVFKAEFGYSPKEFQRSGHLRASQ